MALRSVNIGYFDNTVSINSPAVSGCSLESHLTIIPQHAHMQPYLYTSRNQAYLCCSVGLNIVAVCFLTK